MKTETFDNRIKNFERATNQLLTESNYLKSLKPYKNNTHLIQALQTTTVRVALLLDNYDGLIKEIRSELREIEITANTRDTIRTVNNNTIDKLQGTIRELENYNYTANDRVRTKTTPIK